MYTWRPILDGPLQNRVRCIVDEIAHDLAEDFGKNRDEGLANSALLPWQLADRALFFKYVASCRNEPAYDELAGYCLRLVIEGSSSERALPATVFSGWLAIAWVLEHLQRVFGLEDPRILDHAAMLRDWSRELLSVNEWTGPFDFFKGLVGFGAHALERRGVGSSDADDAVKQVIGHLAELAELDEDERFVSWWSPPEHCGGERSWPDGQYNLGLAHGTPGVVAFLSAAVAAGVEHQHSRELLQKAVAWLLDLSPHFGVSGFPAMVAPNKPFMPSDASWAYGDAGVAMATLSAARALGDTQAERAALDIARRALHRPLEDYLGPPQPGISHGAAGLTHIYTRLYHATSEPMLLQAAREWCERILDHWQSTSSGAAGFPEIHSQLFGGVAGIGLVLLGASEYREPQWDRLLLISI